MLECFAPEGSRTTRDILSYPLLDGVDSWILGARLAASAVPVPLTLEWDPRSKGPKKSFYDATIPLMRKELIHCLFKCGVDNLETVAVEIRDSETGEIDPGYSAINVLGAVAVANLAESKYTDHSGRGQVDLDFDKLVIAPERARGLLFFRLAECVSAIVIASRVKSALEAAGGFGLSFVPPEDWIG